MSVSELFIRRPVMTTLVMGAILIFGIMAYRLLPVSDLPNVDFPTIAVSAALPGEEGPVANGTLTFVDNAVDTSTSTILLKATFPNSDERLWPGQFVDVTVTLGEQPDRVVCPSAAVQTGQQGRYVFVVGDDGTVEQRPVEVDRMDEHDAVIADGLSGGETVVTDGQLRLVPGAEVQILDDTSDGSDAT